MPALVVALALGIAGEAAARAPRALETIVQDDALLLHRPTSKVFETAYRLSGLGVDRVRLTASWSSLAPDGDNPVVPVFDARDPAAYEQARWAPLDQAVRAATGAGLKVMIDIGFWAPRWAAERTDGPRIRTNIVPSMYADFATALARRYSGMFVPPASSGPPPAPTQDASFLASVLGHGEESDAAYLLPPGTVLPRVGVVALWNEPNHPAFLIPTWGVADGLKVPLSAHAYRRMVSAAYPAIKRVRPDMTVLVGNTSSTGGGGGRSPVPPLAFLRELACVDADMQPVLTARCDDFDRVPGDGWAHHPYALRGTPRRTGVPTQRDAIFIGDLRRLRATLGRLAADGRVSPRMRKIWITEMGYETKGDGGPRGVSQELQARYLTWGEYEAARVDGVRSFAQFLLRDVPPAATAQSDSVRRPLGQFASGLERSDGSPKLAMETFKVGLFATRVGRRSVLLWARLRLGDERQTLRFERRVGRGEWEPVDTAAVAGGRAVWETTGAGQGAVTRYTTWVRGARYRIVLPDGPDGELFGRSVPVEPAAGLKPVAAGG